MTDPDLFKYDVRVRERMIQRGLLTEAQVASHVGALRDLEGQCEDVVQPQPAIGSSAAATGSTVQRSTPPVMGDQPTTDEDDAEVS